MSEHHSNPPWFLYSCKTLYLLTISKFQKEMMNTLLWLVYIFDIIIHWLRKLECILIFSLQKKTYGSKRWQWLYFTMKFRNLTQILKFSCTSVFHFAYLVGFYALAMILGIEWSLENDASNAAVLVASEAHAITLAIEGLLGVVFTIATLTDEAVDVGEVRYEILIFWGMIWNPRGWSYLLTVTCSLTPLNVTPIHHRNILAKQLLSVCQWLILCGWPFWMRYLLSWQGKYQKFLNTARICWWYMLFWTHLFSKITRRSHNIGDTKGISSIHSSKRYVWWLLFCLLLLEVVYSWLVLVLVLLFLWFTDFPFRHVEFFVLWNLWILF